jgi:phosphomannomutase/phosphoglucomutase
MKLSKQDSQNLKHIFSATDIHGKYGEDISPQVVYRIGQAFGTFLIEETELRNNAVFVGYDYYKISQILVDTLIAGILSTGINVECSGVPVLHGIAMYSALQRKDYANAFITASPHSADWIEVKFYYGNGVGFFPNNYREIRNIFLKRIFNKPHYSHMGQSQNICLENEYKNYLISKLSFEKPIKVVIACDHGSSCKYILQILKDIGLNAEMLFNGLNKSSESERHSLQLLAQKVRLEKADFGVNFDGDAEQAIIVDNVGRTISNDIIGLIMAEHYLKKTKIPKKSIFASVECSLALEKVLEPKKVIINRIQTGQTHLVENAIENPDTLLGIDKNFMVFPDLFPFHDAILIPLKLAQVLTEDPLSLAKIVDSFPRIYRLQSTESCTNSIKFNVIDELTRECRSRFDTLDSGDDIRIKFGVESWVLIRASKTKPEIIITVEADSQNEAERLMADFTLQVKDLIKISK